MSWMTVFQSLFPAAILCALLTPRASAAEITAHRGASADAPENTLASIKLGYEQGADACELDVHLSKDGRVVVIHDDNTKRTAGVDKKVADQTMDELAALDVGSFERWAGKGFKEHLPTLDQVLPLIPKGKRLFIEIKCGVEILPALEAVLSAGPASPEQTPIISFGLNVCAAAKAKFPTRQVYYLHGYDKNEKTGEYPKLDDLIAQARAAKLDGLDLNFNFSLDRAAVDRIHAAGLKIYVWTLDDPVKAAELTATGIDGITTNVPKALIAHSVAK